MSSGRIYRRFPTSYNSSPFSPAVSSLRLNLFNAKTKVDGVPDNEKGTKGTKGSLAKAIAPGKNNNNDNIVDTLTTNDDEGNNNILATVSITFLTAIAAGAVLSHGVDSPSSIVLDNLKELTTNPKAFLTDAVQTIQNLGDLGYIYFAIIYIVAEILAIPAIPLTASAGYLFGTLKGTGVVLCSASVAAAVSFLIGRTFLRSYVESLVEDNPRFSAIDRAIGKEGFKVILLLRLSPIFPFALSNYLYGSTSVAFWEYFWGTLIGFTPGTFAYVYTGSVGKVLTDGDAMGGEEWYVYVGALAALVGFIKIVSDVATKIVQELEET
ncbi:hypothetical protein TrST_g8341 [Triparma strigata]|uniref:VTT domain-containing protein n=1 Tax=Triparma strigata TaxID=1606541 RepID=A0A9W7B0U4_9STRA|nr:hypothetical protein TrST_g8341 [Triparma strigata]